jgi:hypothetical protein
MCMCLLDTLGGQNQGLRGIMPSNRGAHPSIVPQWCFACGSGLHLQCIGLSLSDAACVALPCQGLLMSLLASCA